MEVTYQLTQRDFFDSFIAHRNRSVVRKWFLRIVVLTVFAFLVIGLLGAILRPYPKVWSDLTPLFVLAAFWIVLLWGSPWLAARRQFFGQPAAQGRRTLLLDSGGVHWRWDGGSSDADWKNYVRFLEGKNQFLIYTSPACFNILPKRALTAEQLSELRALFAQHGLDKQELARKNRLRSVI